MSPKIETDTVNIKYISEGQTFNLIIPLLFFIYKWKKIMLRFLWL